MGQDVVNVIAGGSLFWPPVAATLHPRTGLIVLGLLCYLFYGYGIFAIERMYNALYLEYLSSCSRSRSGR